MLPRFAAMLFGIGCLVGSAVPTAASVDTDDGFPVAAYPGAERLADRQNGDATYPLITSPVTESGGIDANLSATRTVDGVLTRRTYRAPADTAPAALIDHYRNALTKAGFDILFACNGDDCGDAFTAASPGHRVRAASFKAAGQRYIAARLPRKVHDLYVAVQVAGGSPAHIQVDALSVRPRTVAAITIDAEEMARQLRESGHVALYGIYFDTDSARLEPSSEGTLREIAHLLDQRPQLRLLVVGHTDTRGAFEYNIDLSRRRAAAVVRALVEDHDVDRSRLKSWGVGFTVPDDSNRTVKGRAQNRRVELVRW